jgi:hypothetical protein
MDNKNGCYSLEEINFDDEILTSVDATYIIHLVGNGRYDDIKNQLDEYHPTKTVFILHNKGYKKCPKPEVDIPPKDLIDSYLVIFKDAKQKNYNNILVLEDDFIFNEKIKETYHRNNVNNFLTSHENENFIYYLGCVVYMFLIPYDWYHYIPTLHGGTHALIYSKKARDYFLSYSLSEIYDWDAFCINNYKSNKYLYYYPLCYQIFPETENSKFWGNNSIIDKIGVYIAKFISNKMLGLNKYPEPGYTILYSLSKILTVLLFFLIVYVLYKIMLFLPGKLINLSNKLNTIR